MKYTIKHYGYFGRKAKEVGETLLSKESWDAVRIDNDRDILLSIPRDRSAWVKRCLKFQETAERAKAIIELTKSMELSRIISVGVGNTCLEYNIKKFCPSLHLTCTDFTPKSIQRLREVFPECDSIEEFDMLSGKWISQEGTVYLLYGVNTVFDDKQWETIFSDMSHSAVRYVLFIPDVFLTWRLWLREKMRFFKHRMLGRQITFAGYLRTRDTFLSFWVPYYNIKKELPIGQLSGFLLELNDLPLYNLR